ncbi:efflux RND transporter periplasmic adaptor subunit [Parasegetibacter sp. NRK P23]|uniref:efflux RND transporter periplasmic adaptor subunit n=1 Tax=Parasegetibacter sp. NRK P23 TaxID=2942999 RepID=UPI00204468C4|nr:efflux RND transporter periplasmic adaptor subunit [Parasegetibacter sp. NRK P23]MCM5527401.1 efflux RND transporter periplasmic adaptor subunit [Parasegetibacter sp. NRK P23]
MLLNKIRIFAGISSLLFIISCGNKQAQQQQGPPPAVPVTVAEVTSGNVAYFDEYPATVVALNQVELRAQVSGYVTGIFFKDGDRVRKGQKLYSIDAQLYSANVQQAIANLQVQETNLVKAQKDADRYHELDKKDAIAKQQVDYADAALEAAKKQVAAAQANVKSLQSNVNFSTIYAPFDGTIGISQVKTGTAVVAGQTVLNVVSSDNPIAVDFAIDQKEIFRFTQLQGTKNVDSTFTLAFGTDVYPYPGSISVIDRAVDPQTGTLKMRLSFPNAKNMLKAGMSGTVRVKSSAGAESVTIPYKAVTEMLGEFFVYAVGDSNKVTQRKVVLGKQIGTDILVREGLSKGDKIVVQGVQNLREGSVITTEQPGAAPKK